MCLGITHGVQNKLSVFHKNFKFRSIKNFTLSLFMDKICSRCKIIKTIEQFYDGYKKCKNCTDYNRKYENTVHGKLLKYKKDANKRNKTWNLQDNYAKELMVKPCHYCGELYNKLNGIDRLNNDIGYEEGNVVSCCSECNFSKHTSNKEDFIEHAKRITEYQKTLVF